ncbi:MAG: hypothetical protein ACD_48C00003G0003 [uncultured bacterium]|nr:MAG: hypothetical protein ACD_48C00003G0003 [uncultured bacterium]
MKKLKKIPNFKNEDEEFEFWSTHDFMDYFDWNSAVANPDMNELMKGNLVPRETVSIAPSIARKIKARAKKLRLPVDTLVSQYLQQGLSSSRL